MIAARLTLLAFCVSADAASSAPDEVCAACHREQFTAQRTTSMARTLEPAAGCGILRSHPDLKFSDGVYSYRISRRGDASVYSVTDGHETVTVPISWAFGSGAAGQTYVFERDGHWFESRVSYYRSIDGLDFTMGAAGVRAKNLAEAGGRMMSPAGARECFDCHATGVPAGGEPDFAHLNAGIHCQRCHPDSAKHATAARAGVPAPGGTPRLTQSSAEEMSAFCGQCHRTWAQIAAEGPFGIGNIRFQPYRLTNSRCYDPADARIGCTACHDPHHASAAGRNSYDAKCLACHAAGRDAAGRVCKVARTGCAGCHMPKLELPGSHHEFTDHQIRIAKAGDPYPN